MGELRNTHFHAGIDIRTNNAAGLPIRATQRGYISYALVSSHGYGNALFITHPDGNMSVYAHMERFKGKVADYILKKHYDQKSFELSVEFLPDQFPISQGDTIGFVGNTGGSAGPHLHFEIRNRDNEALNPLNFKFDEIKDDLSPVVQKIALKTLDINSRISLMTSAAFWQTRPQLALADGTTRTWRADQVRLQAGIAFTILKPRDASRRP